MFITIGSVSTHILRSPCLSSTIESQVAHFGTAVEPEGRKSLLATADQAYEGTPELEDIQKIPAASSQIAVLGLNRADDPLTLTRGM